MHTYTLIRSGECISVNISLFFCKKKQLDKISKKSKKILRTSAEKKLSYHIFFLLLLAAVLNTICSLVICITTGFLNKKRKESNPET